MNRDIVPTREEKAWPVKSYDLATGASPQDNFSILELSTILKIVREWRWVIAGLTAAGLAVGIAYALITTPMYRAWVMLQVNPPKVQILDDDSGMNAPAQSPRDLVETQVGLLQSTSLAQQVAQDLGLANSPAFVDQARDPRARLRAASTKVRESLTIIPPSEGQLIRFSVSSDSPQMAANIANGVAAAFIKSNLQRGYDSSAYARNFLQRQIAKTRMELESSERQLVAYAQAQGIINTGSGAPGSTTTDANSPEGNSLVALNTALADATAKRVAAEGAYRAARSSGVTSTENQSSQPLRQSRAALQAEYQEKRTTLKPDHPQLVSLQAQIRELDKQIDRENSSVEAGRINELRTNYEAAAAAEKALQRRVSDLKSDVLNLRGRSIQYAILQRDVDTNRALYDALLQRFKEVGVAGGIDTAPVSIVDNAGPPVSPYKPNLILNIIVGLVGGFLLGLLAAIILEYLNDTIKTREDVRQKLRLACLGAIPLRSGKGSFIEDLADPSSAISEAYSTVAASLRFSTESGIPKTILLTSARPSEGKSSSAVALAQIFARRGMPVLLIDCDLRKPAFQSPSDHAGLTKLLTNDDPIAAYVSPTRFENLSLLPAGQVPPNPADLLSTSRFSAILREASAQFDLVIIDAPPMLGLADSALIASISKYVIFVVESGKTRTSLAREAVRNLKASGAHVIGATLTKSTEDHSGYGYGYGYGYKQKYGIAGKKRAEIALASRPSDA